MALIVDFPHCRSAPIKHRVTFADIGEVNIVEDLTIKHKREMWYSFEELDNIKDRTNMVRRKMLSSRLSTIECAELNIQDTCTFVGLEAYLSHGTLQGIVRRRRGVLRAIILEQERQWENGIYDPDALSIISRALSEKAAQRARIIGLLHDDTAG
mmetsp:Transcript_26215/g.44708  ORF Transcript_26215/g.44708 Transcript_26215/m.44708 type:complete len:155 (+) Transcript_26215:203-667(+)|eukprot:CAMPEP_0183739270 /NCGR_PEP_ID=MMETSP0737-20130205/56630_1 /TAXON_ID=385413 /ORGANISM="Thalassiosira miniscula, Strain CCMP1093" /LENGTH=154 /DNA_ID=CAMNT_0025974027 /DNA_START=218 /DNA_END=682 /DNA_ORIENTATION=-